MTADTPARGPVAAAGEASSPITGPLVHPMAAAVAATRDRESGTAHVVNESVNEDLVLARALLGAVQFAVADSPDIGLSWAVAVLRGPDGASVYLTSNEGRGWLPAGLHLPEDVSTPWAWDEQLGGEITASWEGIADPARVLAEFARETGPGMGAAITALASSTVIDAGLRAALPNVALAQQVGPASEVDLREPKPGTVDRLALARSATAAETIAAIPDSGVRQYCLELAVSAHEQLGSATLIPPQVYGVRQARAVILETLTARGEVSVKQWDALRDADDLLAATMLPHRIDTGRIDFGALRTDPAADTLRAMVFERRASELLLLLASEPSQQTLRDAVYAYEQIVAHPQFSQAPTAITVAAPGRAPAAVDVVRTSAPSEITAIPAVLPPSGAIAPSDGAVPPPGSAL
ncbi:hypothetical protein ACFROC_21945 [Nocardia tengchongensis]|uniref:hypothetical protein n=1 Tax=Nocardia tengchongensis TaxID=2055889 RepID=UPI0036A5415F